MKHHQTYLKSAAAGLALLTAAGSAPALAEGLLFWSTQARPVEESQAMREQVLSGFGSEVDYQPQEGGPFITRL
ncbi:MAG: carbohydrate ABC transporter substrate-binding protein, partial [Geminicoccaceae bacterium]